MSVARPRKRLRLSTGSSNAKRLALRLAFKGARSVVRSRMKKRRSIDTPAVTFQNDNRFVYRRRSAPYFVKRRARMRAYRTRTIVNSMLPFNTHLFSWSFARQSATNALAYLWVPLYTGAYQNISSSDPFINFIWQSNQQLERIFRTQRPTGLVAGQEQQLQFTNAVLDLIINSGSSNTSVAIVTVYHCVCRRLSALTGYDLYEGGIYTKASPLVNTAGTIAVTPTFLQVTPFSSSLFCKHFIIQNVREFRISPGNNVTLQLRDRKDYTISSYAFREVGGTAPVLQTNHSYPTLPKYTEGYFVTYRGAPGTTEAPAVTLNFDIDASYRFRDITTSLSSSAFQASYPS